MLAIVAGCGASSAQIMAAKTAEYRAGGGQLLDLAIQAAQEKYRIGEVDGPGRRFITAAQFYNPEGGRESAGAGDVVQVLPGSVRVQFLVEIVEQGEVARVVVVPRTFQVVQGSPQPRELQPDDPNLPPWVHGRVDALYVAIHERAKRFATTTQVRPGTVAPQME
ncbi:MAG: hypothetical protein KIT31_22090 [Deltaproteobacteria bacterium]|nr:hypothetical protein [Deltaproteobacteria bacterium]